MALLGDLHGYQGLPPQKNYHGNGKSPFLIGDTSSNGCFFMVMLVFWHVLQGGPLPVISGVISPINGLING